MKAGFLSCRARISRDSNMGKAVRTMMESWVVKIAISLELTLTGPAIWDTASTKEGASEGFGSGAACSSTAVASVKNSPWPFKMSAKDSGDCALEEPSTAFPLSSTA